MKRLRRKVSVWMAALGLALALVGLLVATGESLRRAERVPPIAGLSERAAAPRDASAEDAYHPAGSPFWRTP